MYIRKKKVKVAQLCPTLCNLMDYSLPGSSIHGIFQARILGWVAIPSTGDFPDPGIKPRFPVLQADSTAWDTTEILSECSVQLSPVAQSCLALCDPMDCSTTAFPVHVFSRQEYQSGLPGPSFSWGSSRQRDWTCSISYLLLHWQPGSLPLVPLAKSKFHRKVYKYSQTGRDW